MPANSGYDRVPLMEPSQEELEKETFWKEIDSIVDGNGNYSQNHVPESRIQIYPEQLVISSNLKLNPTTITVKKYPKERRKAVIAFFLMAFGFICNSISIVLTHQKVPDRDLHPHLPDIM
jgi:hypothetical protein